MMADDTEHQNQTNGAEANPEAAQATVQSAGADAEALAGAISERDEFKDRLLRTLAEMENLRRRTERDVADARTYAVTNFARDMLNAADNIRRALESVPAEARTSAEGAFKGLIEGIELTERDLAKTLERHGVKVVEPHGQRFDPNRHQAMFEVPNTEVPNGTVVQVVQTGYVIGDRTLRPALVGVSKGGPKPEVAKDKPADAA
ncbi:molecular chaperone GrpE [Methylobacterium sp. Leaf456]|uniref:nucleotide exchange factor GrpE n=1 Tax=Methylobacterium sp. Leaf456 TaxID=1736382 RepID=UPI0006F42A39|nr:nucleotide exchange factor GrpE [Methylobacterium sp. Leaf456]KQT57247.1 molecular chaperone GrpE [Methylobacterium sp. Leaf456]